MTISRTPAPYRYPMLQLPTGPRPTAATGLRIAGIVLQAVFAVLAMAPLLVVFLFAISYPGSPGVEMVYLLTGLAAVWFIAGPFLYALLTRSTSSAAWTVVAFFGCGPVPLMIVWALAYLR